MHQCKRGEGLAQANVKPIDAAKVATALAHLGILVAMQGQVLVHAGNHQRAFVFELGKAQLERIGDLGLKTTDNGGIAPCPAVELLVCSANQRAQLFDSVRVLHAQLHAAQREGAVLEVCADSTDQLFPIGEIASWNVKADFLLGGLVVEQNHRARVDEAAQELRLLLDRDVRAEQVEGDFAHIHSIQARRRDRLLTHQPGTQGLIWGGGHLLVNSSAELAVVADVVIVGPAHLLAIAGNCPGIVCHWVKICTVDSSRLLQGCPAGFVLVEDAFEARRGSHRRDWGRLDVASPYSAETCFAIVVIGDFTQANPRHSRQTLDAACRGGLAVEACGQEWVLLLEVGTAIAAHLIQHLRHSQPDQNRRPCASASILAKLVQRGHGRREPARNIKSLRGACHVLHEGFSLVV